MLSSSGTATLPMLIFVSVSVAMTSSLKVGLNSAIFDKSKTIGTAVPFLSGFHEYEEHDTDIFGHGMIHNHLYHSHLNCLH